jgi:hypothetical protein
MVTAANQELFLRRYLTSFTKGNKAGGRQKQKPGRPSARLTVEEFNMQATACALYLALENQLKAGSAMDATKKEQLLSEKRRMFEEGSASHA